MPGGVADCRRIAFLLEGSHWGIVGCSPEPRPCGTLPSWTIRSIDTMTGHA